MNFNSLDIIVDSQGFPVSQYYSEENQEFAVETTDGSVVLRTDVDFRLKDLILDSDGFPLPQLWDPELGEFVPRTKKNGESVDVTELENSINKNEKRTGLKKFITDFGIEGDGETPNLTKLQEAEDEMSALASVLGVRVSLEFPLGVYVVEGTIRKRSNVDWIGQGTICRDASINNRNYALVLGDNVNSFTISGMSFSNLPHHIAHTISGSWSKTVRNCCLNFYDCRDFTVDNCNFTNYSEGIVRTGCKKYKITNNYLNSNVVGKSVEQFLDDSYTDIAGSQSGDITGWVLSSDANKSDEDFLISNNQCLSVGLRIGIEVMTQAATLSPGIITGNIIKGLHHGIKLYKGSYGTLNNAVTNVRQTLISNNYITYCREIGIYIRANLGVLCNGNFLSNCGLFPSSGTAFGGIVTRISAEITDTKLSLNSGNMISGNYIYNSGKVTGNIVTPYGIHVRNANCFVIGNSIMQDENTFTKQGTGIIVGNGDNAEGYVIKQNKISNFQNGINPLNTTIKKPNVNPGKGGIIEGNDIKKTDTSINFFEDDFCLVKNNTFSDFSLSGVRIRNSKEVIASDNYFRDATGSAITIRSGTYDDNINRTGPTIKVFRNTAENVNAFNSVEETASGDTNFQGRCKYFSDNLSDWIKIPSS